MEARSSKRRESTHVVRRAPNERSGTRLDARRRTRWRGGTGYARPTPSAGRTTHEAASPTSRLPRLSTAAWIPGRVRGGEVLRARPSLDASVFPISFFIRSFVGWRTSRNRRTSTVPSIPIRPWGCRMVGWTPTIASRAVEEGRPPSPRPRGIPGSRVPDPRRARIEPSPLACLRSPGWVGAGVGTLPFDRTSLIVSSDQAFPFLPV